MSVSIYHTGSKPKRKATLEPKPSTTTPGRRVKRHTEAKSVNGPKPLTLAKSRKSAGPNTNAKRRAIPSATRAMHRIIATAKRSATFSFDAPSGSDVAVVGTFNRWKRQAMTKGPDGTWRITLQVAPGTHQYRFMVDTYWREDPNNPRKVENHMGGFDSVCNVM